LYLSWNTRCAEGGNYITIVGVPMSIVFLYLVLQNKKLFHQNCDGTARFVVSPFRSAGVPGQG